MFFICLFSIGHFALCAFFFSLSLRLCTDWYSCIVTSTCTYANVASYVVVNRIAWENFSSQFSRRFAINALMIVYDKKKKSENRVMLSHHGQLALDLRPRCWPREFKLTCLRLVNSEHPQSTSQLNVLCYLIVTQWITVQSTSFPQYICSTATKPFFSRSTCHNTVGITLR